jgi:hypothetical protein
MPHILFNGEKYNSIDEMPADQRAAYEQVMTILKDENNNGIPDLFEGDIVQKVMGMANTRIVVNGQEMQGFDSLSPEAHAKLEKVMSRLGLTELNSAGLPSQMARSETAFEQSPPLNTIVPSAISEETGSRTGVIIAVLAVLLLCALAAAGILLYLKF